MYPAIFLVICIAVAAGRFTIPGHTLSWPGTYEALAHIWVGMLLVWCFDTTQRADPFADQDRYYVRAASIWTVVMLTALECIMFFVQVAGR